MAVPLSPVTNNNAKASSRPVRVPPDPKFWKRYSPHYEFLLSLCSSTFVHVVGLAILIGLGILWARYEKDSRPLETDALAIGGGGGNPDGIGKGPGDGAIAPGNEAVTQEPPKEILTPTPKVELENPKAQLAPILDPAKNKLDRMIDVEALSTQRLSAAGKKADEKLRKIAGKGKVGKGNEGGTGPGTGPREGPGIGPGSGGKLTQREKRKQRWMMVFNTLSGLDYARQLRDLGAILAVEQPNGEYKVYRNLDQRPVRGKVEDVRDINLMWWVDDKPRSVDQLARALGISPIPDHIVAFFPVELEQELRRQEQKAFPGSEDDIILTTFHVQKKGGRYEPILENVQHR